jgi:hypothetical protein
MKKTLLLLFWIAGILFPLAWLGKFSQGFRQAFDAVFGPLWMHILMHAGLFAFLALLIALQWSKFSRLARGKLVLPVLGAVLGVGLLQEGFQSLSSGAFLPGAAVIALALASRQRKTIQQG